MKRTLICLLSVLCSVALMAQTQEPGTTNTPGESTEMISGKSSASVDEAEYQMLKQQIESNQETVESKYFIEKEVFNSYNSTYSTTTVSVKRKIYKAGEILLDEQKNKLNETPESDLRTRFSILQKIEKIQNQLIYLGDLEDTRQIEKKLKKLEEPNAIAPVFFGEG